MDLGKTQAQFYLFSHVKAGPPEGRGTEAGSTLLHVVDSELESFIKDLQDTVGAPTIPRARPKPPQTDITACAKVVEQLIAAVKCELAGQQGGPHRSRESLPIPTQWFREGFCGHKNAPSLEDGGQEVTGALDPSDSG